MRPSEPDIGRSIRLGALWALSLMTLITLGMFWFGFDETLAQLERINPRVLLLVLGLSFLNYLLRAVRWQILCRVLEIRVPFGRNALYFFAGFAFTVTPGKLGEVVRLWLLRRDHGAAYERTLSLLVMDRVTDAVPMLALCLLGTARFAGQSWSVVAMIALMLGTLALLLHPGWLTLAIKLLYGRLRRTRRLFGRALRLVRALRALTAPSVLALALALGDPGLVGGNCGRLAGAGCARRSAGIVYHLLRLQLRHACGCPAAVPGRDRWGRRHHGRAAACP